MRLRVLLTACVALALAVVATRSVLIGLDTRSAESLDRQRQAIEVMARDAAGLLVLTQDFLLHGNPRSVRQWHVVHHELTGALSEYAMAGPAQQLEVRELLAAADNLPPLFEGLRQVPAPPDSPQAEARRETLADQLVNETRRISDGAFVISHALSQRRRDASATQRWQGLVAQGVMLSLTLLLAGLLLRRVLRPISRLQRGAEKVQQGDLAARIGYRSGDELGQLSQAFDAMTAALQERAAALQASNERLARSEAFRERAGRIAGVGGWELDLDSDRLIWSEQTREINEVGADHVPTLASALGFYPPEARARITAAIAAATHDGTPWDLELPLVTARGNPRWVRATGTAEFRNGRPVRLVGAVQDITARRLADEALREATRAAQAASEAKSAFLANMSHEIRTPLNAVIGLGYLLQQTKLDAEQHALLAKAQAAGRSLLEVIDDVLDLSKIEAGEMAREHAPFDLHRLLEELVGVFRPQAVQRGVALVLDLPAGLPPRLGGDAARLRQVLTNLMSNALKFTPAGEVRLSVRREGDDNAPQLRFVVQDSGIGMAPALLTRLFTPFTQADASTTRRFGGTGLGLSIVKRLVDLMGGTIDVDSTPGRGSRFELALPFEACAPAPEADAAERAIEVLVADVDPARRQAMQTLAASLGWRSDTVGDAADLFERLHERSRGGGPAVDVLLVAAPMPGAEHLPGLAASRRDDGNGAPPVVVYADTDGPAALAPATARARPGDDTLPWPTEAWRLFNAVHAAVSRSGGDTGRLMSVSRLDAAGVASLPGVKVLVADDSDVNLEVARRVLEDQGAIVEVAHDGEQAVALLRAAPRHFDAVLMDVQMPVLDGLDATRRIRGELGLTRLPVLALTAGALLSERQRALDAGMGDFISKPFEPQALVALLHRRVEQARGRRLPLALRKAAPEVDARSWPQIAGIDRADVSRRLEGDLALFTGLLERLVQDFRDLASADTGSASKEPLAARMHKLGGSAGLLGAPALRQAALEAESALRANPDSNAATSALAAARAALQALLVASAPWLAQACAAREASHDVATDGAPAAAADAEALAAWRERLLTRDLGALSQFAALAPGIGVAWGAARLDAIESAMDRLDFDEVLTLLDQPP